VYQPSPNEFWVVCKSCSTVHEENMLLDPPKILWTQPQMLDCHLQNCTFFPKELFTSKSVAPQKQKKDEPVLGVSLNKKSKLMNNFCDRPVLKKEIGIFQEDVVDLVVENGLSFPIVESYLWKKMWRNSHPSLTAVGVTQIEDLWIN